MCDIWELLNIHQVLRLPIVIYHDLSVRAFVADAVNRSFLRRLLSPDL